LSPCDGAKGLSGTLCKSEEPNANVVVPPNPEESPDFAISPPSTSSSATKTVAVSDYCICDFVNRHFFSAPPLEPRASTDSAVTLIKSRCLQ
jgi:hypothetical protein